MDLRLFDRISRLDGGRFVAFDCYIIDYIDFITTLYDQNLRFRLGRNHGGHLALLYND